MSLFLVKIGGMRAYMLGFSGSISGDRSLTCVVDKILNWLAFCLSIAGMGSLATSDFGFVSFDLELF
jgi:hypothetical protein